MHRNELLRLDQVAWISFSTKISLSRVTNHVVCSFEIGMLVSHYFRTNKKVSGEHSNAACSMTESPRWSKLDSGGFVSDERHEQVCGGYT